MQDANWGKWSCKLDFLPQGILGSSPELAYFHPIPEWIQPTLPGPPLEQQQGEETDHRVCRRRKELFSSLETEPCSKWDHLAERGVKSHHQGFIPKRWGGLNVESTFLSQFQERWVAQGGGKQTLAMLRDTLSLSPQSGTVTKVGKPVQSMAGLL